MAEIPKIIRVGAIDFTVSEVERLVDGDRKLLGQVLYVSSQIKIEAQQERQAQYQTLWHEVVHAFLVAAGRQDVSEDLIDCIAYGIVAALRDNPYLREFFNA